MGGVSWQDGGGQWPVNFQKVQRNSISEAQAALATEVLPTPAWPPPPMAAESRCLGRGVAEYRRPGTEIFPS